VKCDLETLEQREKSRGDRVIGMAKIFHQSEKNFRYPYDLTIDTTTNNSPFTSAKEILKFVEKSF